MEPAPLFRVEQALPPVLSRRPGRGRRRCRRRVESGRTQVPGCR